jgi:hypothetical protein
MRQFIIAAAMALGLVALWAAILPLTAKPAPAQTAAASAPISPAMSKALFLCRGPNGIDGTCAAALAKALVLEASDNTATRVSDRLCRVDQEMRASFARHD